MRRSLWFAAAISYVYLLAFYAGAWWSVLKA